MNAFKIILYFKIIYIYFIMIIDIHFNSASGTKGTGKVHGEQ